MVLELLCCFNKSKNLVEAGHMMTKLSVSNHRDKDKGHCIKKSAQLLRASSIIICI